MAPRYDVPIDWKPPVALVGREHPVGASGEDASGEGLAFLVRFSMNGDRQEVGVALGQLVDQPAESVREEGLAIQLAAVSQLHHDQPPAVRGNQARALLIGLEQDAVDGVSARLLGHRIAGHLYGVNQLRGIDFDRVAIQLRWHHRKIRSVERLKRMLDTSAVDHQPLAVI